MLKTEIFTEPFSDFSDCEDDGRFLVDKDFGWKQQTGVALQALPQTSSAPHTEEHDDSCIFLSGLKAHHLVTEINQAIVCQLKPPRVCL